MVECKVCGHEYSDKREHCPVCGCYTSTAIMPGLMFSTHDALPTFRLGVAHGAMRVKQNLYDGKVLGLRVR